MYRIIILYICRGYEIRITLAINDFLHFNKYNILFGRGHDYLGKTSTNIHLREFNYISEEIK